MVAVRAADEDPDWEDELERELEGLDVRCASSLAPSAAPFQCYLFTVVIGALPRCAHRSMAMKVTILGMEIGRTWQTRSVPCIFTVILLGPD